MPRGINERKTSKMKTDDLECALELTFTATAYIFGKDTHSRPSY